MGYVCPVCDVKQADARHLANHLAVTASLGRQDHLEWLEEYAPEWADCGPDELGEVVAEAAFEVETPDFSGEQGHGHGHSRADDVERGRPDIDFEGGLARQTQSAGRGSMTSETDSVLAAAREMTEEMYAEGSGDDEDQTQESADGDKRETNDGESETASTAEADPDPDRGSPDDTDH